MEQGAFTYSNIGAHMLWNGNLITCRHTIPNISTFKHAM